MNVRITQIDGNLPNLALMKLSHWHKAKGDAVHFTRNVRRDLFESDYDRVYASAIFTFSDPLVRRMKEEWPEAVIGGTGAQKWRVGPYPTVEEYLGVPEYEFHDYELYPNFTGSIGFTQRGCLMKCGFCIVPVKEGKPRATNTIAQIWRGEPHPKHIHLLDNDFFGQPRDVWEARIQELIDGNFKVCFNQGINTRLITQPYMAQALASVQYYDDGFKTRRIYTAWDNIGDEAIFFKGINRMLDAGIKAPHIMVYMLIGYDPNEDFGAIFYRLNKMLEMGLMPYPMVYNNANRELKLFQKWILRRYYQIVPWPEFQQQNGHGEKLHRLEKMLRENGSLFDAGDPDTPHRRELADKRRAASLFEATDER